MIWHHISLITYHRLFWLSSQPIPDSIQWPSGGFDHSLIEQMFSKDLSISDCTHAHGFYRFCRAIEWNLEACSPLWLRIWIQMCLSQVVNFLCTQLWAANKKKAWKKRNKFFLKSAVNLPWVGNFDKLTQVCFGGGSKFQSQYIWLTKAKSLCIASKQEIKRSLIAEFDNFRSQGIL